MARLDKKLGASRNLGSEYRRIPDIPIDYSIPYQSRVKEAARHFGFFPFFAKKPWPVVQEYIKHYSSSGDLILDPFSGSGVTPVEALVLGRRAVASDINPVARFITQMTAVAPVDIDSLDKAYESVRSVAQYPIEKLDSLSEAAIRNLLQNLDYPHSQIPRTVRRVGADTVDQLHTLRQLAGLTILRDTINKTNDELLRDLLKVALANTVRYANKTYAGRGKEEGSQYRGNANFLRRFSFSFASEKLFYEHQVWPTFERSFRAVVKAKAETNRLIGKWYSEQNFVLASVPASKIHTITGEQTVDYCFTDPPYSNDIHFLDLSILWADWLGMDISPEVHKAELLIGGTEKKSREEFEKEFATAMESIARCLKENRWFTLVYKHKDLSLWQSIVNACEQSGLRYINAVWQDLKITSTRQLENPAINPKGDMYLNFRKLAPKSYAVLYPTATVIDLPTLPNYLEKEIERLIVSYLGADIKLITSGVIQQILDSRIFRNYSEDLDALENDIRKVLKGSRFTTWRPDPTTTFWVLGEKVVVDSSLPMIDRVRYCVFALFHEKGEVTEGETNKHLLTQFSTLPDVQVARIDLRAILRQIGSEVAPRRWRFEPKRVNSYKQLRLFFQRAKADDIRRSLERREGKRGSLHLNFEGIALLVERLRTASSSDKHGETKIQQMLDVLKVVLARLIEYFEEEIDQVRAVGEWARSGIDLRNLPFEDVMIQIIVRSEICTFATHQEIAEKVFGDLDDNDIHMQFKLVTFNEWQQIAQRAKESGDEDSLGISLIDRV